jgi:hypothetical protein
MHAILVKEPRGTMHLFIVDNDPETGTEVITKGIPGNIEQGSHWKMYKRASTLLLEHGYHSLSPWREKNPLEHQMLVEHRAENSTSQDSPSEADAAKLIARARQQNRAALDRLNDGPAPAQADEMLAISQTLALRALKTADTARAEASVGGQDHTQNPIYIRARAAFDAHCEQLAQLMWVRKVQEAKAGDETVTGVPNQAEVLRSILTEGVKLTHQQPSPPHTITAEQMHRSFLIADLRDQED